MGYFWTHNLIFSYSACNLACDSASIPNMKLKSNRTKVLYRRVKDDEELIRRIDELILQSAAGSFNSDWKEYGGPFGVGGVGKGQIKEESLADAPFPPVLANPKPFETQVPVEISQGTPKPVMGLETAEVVRLRFRIKELEAKVKDYETMYS